MMCHTSVEHTGRVSASSHCYDQHRFAHSTSPMASCSSHSPYVPPARLASVCASARRCVPQGFTVCGARFHGHARRPLTSSAVGRVQGGHVRSSRWCCAQCEACTPRTAACMRSLFPLQSSHSQARERRSRHGDSFTQAAAYNYCVRTYVYRLISVRFSSQQLPLRPHRPAPVA